MKFTPLPTVVATILEPTELESIRLRLKQLPEPPPHARWDKHDWLGALGVFILLTIALGG